MRFVITVVYHYFRSMLKNPLDVEGMNYDVDVTDFPTDDSEWNEIDLSTLDDHRREWNMPKLDIDTAEAFNNLSLGTYR